LIPKLTIWLLSAIVLASAGSAYARGQKADDPQSDPVMKALSQGVDTLPPNSPPGLQRRGERYHVTDSDVLELTFQFTPDFNQTVTVQPDGFVTLREIGDVQVAGKTVPEIKQTLQQAYAKILANPVITVDLKDFQKPYFLAIGQVFRPGKYDLRGETTVSAAVAIAGGFTPEAKHSQVLLFRRVNDQWSSVTKIDLKHLLDKSKDLREDVALPPGDMVYVPKSAIAKVRSFIPNYGMSMYQPIP
jgi:polysaccharide biosynthesis/export protein